MKHYEAKFGAAKVRSMIPHMKAVAGEHGIQMEYGGHVGNTFDSHVRVFIIIYCDIRISFFSTLLSRKMTLISQNEFPAIDMESTRGRWFGIAG